MYQDCNQRNDPFGLEVLEDIWWHNSLCHSGCGDRCDNVGEDVVLETLLCECLSETNLCELGSWNVSARFEISS